MSDLVRKSHIGFGVIAAKQRQGYQKLIIQDMSSLCDRLQWTLYTITKTYWLNE
ncbi:hypothetical protein [Nostoc sp. DSM 114161]|uniref:hypothetical protein n=1 Tax=Nostoc sp. DSM 114161 TaxID=3440143 RepID=UPI0040461A08